MARLVFHAPLLVMLLTLVSRGSARLDKRPIGTNVYPTAEPLTTTLITTSGLGPTRSVPSTTASTSTGFTAPDPTGAVTSNNTGTRPIVYGVVFDCLNAESQKCDFDPDIGGIGVREYSVKTLIPDVHRLLSRSWHLL